MNYIDYILIGVILVGFILGYKDGLVRKIIGLIGLITAIYIAVTYSETLGEYLSPMFNDENYLAKIISGLVLFLATILAFAIIKRLIHPTDKVNKFLNQLLGGIAGTIQIIFFASVFLLLFNIMSIPKQEDIDESLLYLPIYSVIPSTIDLIVGADFKTEGFIKDYIESKNDKEV
ncbi:MAG: CvpA family protein, partial [Melioribacteraceae bacterium]|nr:CvpA family protein [Melioribacteraceae bacterium]